MRASDQRPELSVQQRAIASQGSSKTVPISISSTHCVGYKSDFHYLRLAPSPTGGGAGLAYIAKAGSTALAI